MEVDIDYESLNVIQKILHIFKNNDTEMQFDTGENDSYDSFTDEDNDNNFQGDQFNDFIMPSYDPDYSADIKNIEGELYNSLPSTNIGELSYEVEEVFPKKGLHISGYGILNQFQKLLHKNNTKLIKVADKNLSFKEFFQ